MAQYPATIELSSLDGTNGFRLSGVAAADRSGISVASAGDVNGDGFADLIVGALDADPNGSASGASYVVFGQASGFSANLDLSSLDGSNGFRLSGETEYDRSGKSVASAGDVNGDGFADLIVGAFKVGGTGPNGLIGGASYVVFGQASGFAANLDLSNLNGSNGFRLTGAFGNDSGWSVASAGDVNGDGFADVIIGSWAYGSYVVFGKETGFAASIELRTLTGSNGFGLDDYTSTSQIGYSVASAGDVNGDGFADVIVGAPRTYGYYDHLSASYVVFGNAAGFAASFDLATLDGSNGFKLTGVSRYDYTGSSVASAGDVNGDGFADVVISALSSKAYVVFGKASGIPSDVQLSTLDGSNGFKLNSVAADYTSGASVAAAGDVNGDGFGDLIVGAPRADPNGTDSGASYVIFGRAPDTAVDRTGTAAAQTLAGGAFDDTLSGLGGNDRLHGNAGNDELDGGTGADTMIGGDGDDTYIVDNVLDVVVETGTGYDRLSTSVSVALTADQAIEFLSGRGTADLTLTGNQLNNSIWGSAGNDTLAGDAGNDILRGKGGNDTLLGGDGDDTYMVDDASDVVVETGTGYDRISTSASITLTAGQAIDFLSGRGTANLTLAGNQLANSVWGSAGNDTVAGAGGNDILRGKGGNDMLFGGKGDDILEGGAGADLFRYRLGDGNDRFTDFSGAGGDRVALVNVTVAQLVNNIATMSDGSILTAQTGYMWAASDFMPA